MLQAERTTLAGFLYVFTMAFSAPFFRRDTPGSPLPEALPSSTAAPPRGTTAASHSPGSQYSGLEETTYGHIINILYIPNKESYITIKKTGHNSPGIIHIYRYLKGLGNNVVVLRIFVIGKTVNCFWVCILQKNIRNIKLND